MEVQITYNEVLQFLSSHANVDTSRLQIVRNNSRTLVISYEISRWIPTVMISVSLDMVAEYQLSLSYDCSAAASMIISGALAFLESKIPAGVKVDTSAKTVYIYLDVINGLEKVLQYITPIDICFDVDAICLKGNIK